APKATLTGGISPADRLLPVEYFEGATQFANLQFLKIGEETVRVVERTRTTVTVDRGMDGTAAVAHTAGAQIFPMRDVQAKPAAPINEDALTVTVPETFGHLFSPNTEIQIGTEIMMVTGVTGDVLQVERGIAGTKISAHGTDRSIAQADYVTLGEFFTNTVWQPQTGEYGICALWTATLLTSGIALVVAIPCCLGPAVYLSEYASPKTHNTLKPILEIL